MTLILGCPSFSHGSNNEPTMIEKIASGELDVRGIWSAIMGGSNYSYIIRFEENNAFAKKYNYFNKTDRFNYTLFSLFSNIPQGSISSKFDEEGFNLALGLTDSKKLIHLNQLLSSLDEAISSRQASTINSPQAFINHPMGSDEILVSAFRLLKENYYERIEALLKDQPYFESYRTELLELFKELYRISKNTVNVAPQKINETEANNIARSWFKKQTHLDYDSIPFSALRTNRLDILYNRLKQKALLMTDTNKTRSVSRKDFQKFQYQLLLSRLIKIQKNYSDLFHSRLFGSNDPVFSVWVEDIKGEEIKKIAQGYFHDLTPYFKWNFNGFEVNPTFRESVGNKANIYILNVTDHGYYHDADHIDSSEKMSFLIYYSSLLEPKMKNYTNINPFDFLGTRLTSFTYLYRNDLLSSIFDPYILKYSLNSILGLFSSQLQNYLQNQIETNSLTNNKVYFTEAYLPHLINQLENAQFKSNSFGFYIFSELHPIFYSDSKGHRTSDSTSFDNEEFASIFMSSPSLMIDPQDFRFNKWSFRKILFSPESMAKLYLLGTGYHQHLMKWESRAINNSKSLSFDHMYNLGKTSDRTYIKNHSYTTLSPNLSTNHVIDLTHYLKGLGTMTKLNLSYNKKPNSKTNKVMFSISNPSRESHFFIFSNEDQISKQDPIFSNTHTSHLKSKIDLTINFEYPIKPHSEIILIPTPIYFQFHSSNFFSADKKIIPSNKYEIRQSSDGGYYFEILDQSLMTTEFTFSVHFSKLNIHDFPYSISIKTLKDLTPELREIGLSLLADEITNLNKDNLLLIELISLIKRSTIFNESNPDPYKTMRISDTNRFKELAHLVNQCGFFIGVCRHSAALTDIILKIVFHNNSAGISTNPRSGILLYPFEIDYKIGEETHAISEVKLNNSRYYFDSTSSLMLSSLNGDFLKRRKDKIDINSIQFMSFTEHLTLLIESQNRLTLDRQRWLKILRQRNHPLTRLIGVSTGLKNYFLGNFNNYDLIASLGHHLDDMSLYSINTIIRDLIPKKTEIIATHLANLNIKLQKKQKFNLKKQILISEQDLISLEGMVFWNHLKNLLEEISKFDSYSLLDFELIPEALGRFLMTHPESKLYKILSKPVTIRAPIEDSLNRLDNTVKILNHGKDPNTYRPPRPNACKQIFMKFTH